MSRHTYRAISHFCGIDYETDEIVYGGSVHAKDVDGEACVFIGFGDEDVRVITESVGQHTGFYDSEGDGIYEGDQIISSDIPGGKGTVAYVEGRHGYLYNDPDIGESFCGFHHLDTGKLIFDFEKTTIARNRAKVVHSFVGKRLKDAVEWVKEDKESEE